METLWETPESITDYITRQSAGEVSHILRWAQEGKWFDLFKATYTQNWYTEDHFASIALAGIGCSKYWIGIVRKNEGLKAQLVDFFGW